MDCATYIEQTGLDEKKRIGALVGTTLCRVPGGLGEGVLSTVSRRLSGGSTYTVHVR